MKTIEDDSLLNTLKSGYLPGPIYKVIQENAVLSTVDFIIRRPDGTFLLITRVGNRWPNVRWFFGGSQRRGETLLEALERLAFHEAGLKPNEFEASFSHAQDVYNPPSEQGVEPSFPAQHTLMHVFILRVAQDFEPKLDRTSTDPRWHGQELWHNNGSEFEKLPEPVKNALLKAEMKMCGY